MKHSPFLRIGRHQHQPVPEPAATSSHFSSPVATTPPSVGVAEVRQLQLALVACADRPSRRRAPGDQTSESESILLGKKLRAG